jgi:hypothetical protein
MEEHRQYVLNHLLIKAALHLYAHRHPAQREDTVTCNLLPFHNNVIVELLKRVMVYSRQR